jgi:hypothetical protein
MKISKFKVGDEVILARNYRDIYFIKYKYIGEKGIIKSIDISLSAPIEIKFNKRIDVDSWFVEGDLELVSTMSEMIKFAGDDFQIGDIVEFNEKGIEEYPYTAKTNAKATIKDICTLYDGTKYAEIKWDNNKDLNTYFLKYLKKVNNSINQSNQPNYDESTTNKQIGKSFNLPRATTTVTRGKELIGSSITGRRSRISITIGSYRNKAISC